MNVESRLKRIENSLGMIRTMEPRLKKFLLDNGFTEQLIQKMQPYQTYTDFLVGEILR